MDFFERQAQAHHKTKLLAVYFVMAVVCIVASVYFVCLLLFFGAETRHHGYGETAEIALWNPSLFFYVAAGTLGVIACGSFYKTAALAAGGSAVAETLGGRLINPNTTDPDERKLRNVVEEMAIASGVPVPKIYVLDAERGINAFAASHAASDAAVAVTRGAMTLLSRDELQGVIGHEFSHILNGDMRLNLRLIGTIFGILCLATLGRILLRTRGRKNALPLVGLALIVIGAVGVFFGRLIQAAISRQREFLADASSVQFTRNPAGLSGALQKIGGLADGSRLESEHAADACHMFFANGLGEAFFNAMATHPPLDERIRAIDPSWEGKFPHVSITAAQVPEPELKKTQRPPILFPFPGLPQPPAGMAGLAGLAAAGLEPQTILPTLGNPTPQHLRYAVELRNSFPESVQAASREPLAAIALIYAMLLSPDDSLRATQLKQLAEQTTATVCEKTVALLPDVAAIARRARLPLINLALPPLRHLTAGEFQQFSKTLQWLIESDGQIELFEYVLQKIIRRNLEPQFSKARPPIIQYYAIKPLLPDCALVLSALAQVGSDDPAQIESALRQGAPYVRAADAELQLVPRAACGLAQVDAALSRLAEAVPQIKKNFLEACAHTVGADGVILESEAELLRAVADTLDCPIPPFVQIQGD